MHIRSLFHWTPTTIALWVLVVGLFITSTRWMFWEVSDNTLQRCIEPVFVWPLLAYAIVYAYRESRRTKAA